MSSCPWSIRTWLDSSTDSGAFYRYNTLNAGVQVPFPIPGLSCQHWQQPDFRLEHQLSMHQETHTSKEGLVAHSCLYSEADRTPEHNRLTVQTQTHNSKQSSTLASPLVCSNVYVCQLSWLFLKFLLVLCLPLQLRMLTILEALLISIAQFSCISKYFINRKSQIYHYSHINVWVKRDNTTRAQLSNRCV